MKLTLTQSSRFGLAFVVLFMSLEFPLTAHEGHHHHGSSTSNREWSLEDGMTFEGSFVSAKPEHTTIRLEDGQTIEIRTNRLSKSDQEWVRQQRESIVGLNRSLEYKPESRASGFSNVALTRVFATTSIRNDPGIAVHFQPFVKNKSIKTRWDEQFFYVES
ncbi:MAG: hypothetical protein GY818_22270, partial [Planctomycetaceae bacterium]|nr:hypothetical protein [Planctomycetaceae bacterium]